MQVSCVKITFLFYFVVDTLPHEPCPIFALGIFGIGSHDFAPSGLDHDPPIYASPMAKDDTCPLPLVEMRSHLDFVLASLEPQASKSPPTKSLQLASLLELRNTLL
jgi:hypothetical protein